MKKATPKYYSMHTLRPMKSTKSLIQTYKSLLTRTDFDKYTKLFNNDTFQSSYCQYLLPDTHAKMPAYKLKDSNDPATKLNAKKIHTKRKISITMKTGTPKCDTYTNGNRVKSRASSRMAAIGDNKTLNDIENTNQIRTTKFVDKTIRQTSRGISVPKNPLKDSFEGTKQRIGTNQSARRAKTPSAYSPKLQAKAQKKLEQTLTKLNASKILANTGVEIVTNEPSHKHTVIAASVYTKKNKLIIPIKQTPQKITQKSVEVMDKTPILPKILAQLSHDANESSFIKELVHNKSNVISPTSCSKISNIPLTVKRNPSLSQIAHISFTGPLTPSHVKVDTSSTLDHYTKDTAIIIKKKETLKPIKAPVPWQLSESEKQVYGNRIPNGYQKIDLLGRGGCALVWLGYSSKHKKQVALKQFAKTGDMKSKSDIQSSKNEIEISQRIFDSHGNPRRDICEFPGVKYVAALLDQIDEKHDFWLVYDVGGPSLNKSIFDIKGEFYKGERIYKVTHQAFFEDLKSQTILLKSLLRMVAETLTLFSHLSIVHLDLKSDNILIDYDETTMTFKGIKIIDFGSAFIFNTNSPQVHLSTPEYMPPEILDYLRDGTGNSKVFLSKLERWSIDIWSLGAIFLEILTGFPLWLSLKGRVETKDGKSVVSTGLFGVNGRDTAKILMKQQNFLSNILNTLRKYHCFGLDKDEDAIDLLKKLLEPNPTKRISPEQVLNHHFLKY